MTELLNNNGQNRQLSEKAVKELGKTRPPVALLGELPDDEIPDYLYPLVIAARMLNNFAVYDDPASNRARALWIIKQTRRELGHAEARCALTQPERPR